jgi:hypothetical protein
MVAYSPVSAAARAAWAYPMPTGTSRAVRTSPAIRSLPSQARRYSRRVRSPGTHRCGAPARRPLIAAAYVTGRRWPMVEGNWAHQGGRAAIMMVVTYTVTIPGRSAWTMVGSVTLRA